MPVPKTIDDLNRRFMYRSDKFDGYSLMKGDVLRGDCDDYALTAAYVLSGHSWIKFWWKLLTLQIQFIPVEAPAGRHVMLWCEGKGYICNITRKFNKNRPFPKNFPWYYPAPWILMKMVFGKVFD